LLLVAAVIFLVWGLIPLLRCDAAAENGQPPRAAIVDQLYLLEPNPAFVSGASATLASGGFAVDVWQGDNITVDLYRELPRYGYRLIILRVHSGILLSLEGDEVKPLPATYLFTGETYTTTKYVAEQLSDKVSNAMMSDKYPLVFAVNSEFVRDDLKDVFNRAVIIAMGCESYYEDDMAAAFLERGASAYIGWDTLVSLEHTDNATLNLLARLCTDNLTLGRAVEETMAAVGRDPHFGTCLKYSAGSGDKTLKELIE